MADAHVTIQVTGAAASVNVNVNPASLQGPKGDPFTYEDFTPEQLEGLRGPQGIQGEKGEKGDAFEYDDFTAEQLEGLRGPQGEVGPAGAKGDTGQPGQTGEPGPQGETGEAGVGIADVIIEEILRPSPGVGGHTMTVVLTDGRQYSFDVNDGKNGSTGPRGEGITEIKLAGAGVDQYGRHYQIIEIWWMFTSDAGSQPTVTRYTVYDGKDGEDAKVVQEVEETGTDAVSGAAVAAYVDVRVAQLGLYVLITAQPVSMTVNKGETAMFTVAAVGKGLTYQWQYRASESADWANSQGSGATTANVSFLAQAFHDGFQFRCVITDTNGNEATTEPVTLTVIENIVITKQPENVTTAVGETAVFSVTAQGSDLTYQWEFSHNNGINWGNVPRDTATTPELVMSNVGDYHNGYIFRCIITDSRGNTVTSDGATLTVVPILITKQPENVTVPVGETAVFSITAQGNGLTYQWQYSTDNGSYWTNSGKDGNKTDTLTMAVADYHNGYLWRCEITAADGTVVYSEVVTLTVTSA